MPMAWVEPETFLEYAGETVYVAYKSGMWVDVSEFWYQIKSDYFDTAYATFDIRDVAYVVGDRRPPPREDELVSTHKAVLRGAIDLAHKDNLSLEEWLAKEQKRRKSSDLWQESEEP